MSNIDVSQIKFALVEAKNASAAKDKHRDSLIRQANLSKRSQILTNQRAVEQLFTSFLIKTGFEIDKFNQILAKNQTELRSIFEKQKADAVEQSTSVRDKFRYGIDSRRKTIEHLKTLAAPSFPFFVALDSPFLILPTNGLNLTASQIEPRNSWAKFIMDVDEPTPAIDGYHYPISEELSFYFLWENPSDKFAVLNVDGYLVSNGHCTAHIDGGFFAGDRSSSISIDQHLSLLEWWNQPPTQPLQQTDQSLNILNLYASAMDMFDSGETKSANVFRGCDLRFNLFLVPPNKVVVFEVTSSISYNLTDDGYIQVDFDSGDFEVMCPEVLLAILT
jgi:hypothetical protein